MFSIRSQSEICNHSTATKGMRQVNNMLLNQQHSRDKAMLVAANAQLQRKKEISDKQRMQHVCVLIMKLLSFVRSFCTISM